MNKPADEQSKVLRMCVENIIKTVEEENRKIENRGLQMLCGDLGSMFNGRVNPHFFHEVAETAFNALIKRKYARRLLRSENPAASVNQVIRPIADRLPTQTWRSRRQSALQQFSTPPAIAYLLAYLTNMKPGERVLEPSAGTGGLAVWSDGIGLKTHANEIDPRRRALLRQIGFAPTGFDAEFINDFLPPEVKIDCVLMNPPFSASGERTANNSSKFGFRHVESALERLKKGGRFGIILGEAGGLDAKTGNDFWRKLSDRIKVRALIKISGREYYKNGSAT